MYIRVAPNIIATKDITPFIRKMQTGVNIFEKALLKIGKNQNINISWKRYAE